MEWQTWDLLGMESWLSRTKERKALRRCIRMSTTKKSASNVWWMNGESALSTTGIGFYWDVGHFRRICSRWHIKLSQWSSIGSLTNLDLRCRRASGFCPSSKRWNTLKRTRPSECLTRYACEDDRWSAMLVAGFAGGHGYYTGSLVWLMLWDGIKVSQRLSCQATSRSGVCRRAELPRVSEVAHGRGFLIIAIFTHLFIYVD